MHAQKSWQLEMNSGYLYRVLSDHESGTARQLLFLELATEADQQAGLWANEIRKTGDSIPEPHHPPRHIKALAWLIRKFGPRGMRPLLAAMKLRGLSVYAESMASGQPMPDNEEPNIANSRGNLRTVLLGLNDGLVSIALLVMGLAGAQAQFTSILLTGVAGLMAGALSMAIGEWIPLRSRREISEREIRPKDDELADYPLEMRELAHIYEARGKTRHEALTLAKRLIDDSELGMDSPRIEQTLLGAAGRGAQLNSGTLAFFAFASGGMIPLMPYLLGLERHPLLITVCLSFVAMFTVGAAQSLLTSRNAIWSGFRMVILGVAAGAVSYFIGDLLGAKLS